MQEPTVSVSRLAAYTLWIVSLALLATAWPVLLFVDPCVGGGLGLTAVVVTGWAATLQIRCWMTRVTTLIRATGGLPPAGRDRDSEGGVYSLRR